MDSHIAMKAFVDELVRCGLEHACTSPGSRSTPILLALARDERVRAWSHIDERCAAFFALGAAKASGRPVAMCCTSGTAAAHFFPAVIEAWEARVPLIVLTADRPPELREVGAGQTIDQLKLYGSSVKWFADVDDAPATPERLRWIRQLAARAWYTALDGRPGPVHINLAFREPLVPGGEPVPEDEAGRGNGAPWVSRPAPHFESQRVELPPRALVLAGRMDRGALPELPPGYPLLAEPLSGARSGPQAIAHYDALLRDDEWAAAHRPELVLRFGDLPTSKPLRLWLKDVPQIAVDPEAAWQDPFGAVTRIVHCAGVHGTAEPGWLEAWRSADDAAAQALDATLGDELSEPRVVRELGARLPDDATLVVASSMPVRDVETFLPARDDALRVLSNRGANGIDGTISTAYGVAACERGPVVLLTGDVTFAHDIGGLLTATRLGLKVVHVVLDNDGGGIFHFLPVAGEGAAFAEHVATPHGLDFAHAAALYGLAFARTADLPGFRAQLDAALARDSSTIIVVPSDRERNVAVHRACWEAVRSRR